MPTTASFRAVTGSVITIVTTLIHIATTACPYWFRSEFHNTSVHEGLIQRCVTNTSRVTYCNVIPSRYPLWFQGLSVFCELITIATAVWYVYKGKSYNNWLSQFFCVFAGVLNATGAIIYTQRKLYSEWNLDSSRFISTNHYTYSSNPRQTVLGILPLYLLSWT